MEIVKMIVIDFRKRGVDRKLLDEALRETLPKIGKLVESSIGLILETALKESERVEKERDNIKFEKLRSDYLGRIIISKIEGLFPSYSDAGILKRVCNEQIEGVIPRQVIPGLLEATKDLLGRDFMEKKEKESENLVSKHYKSGSSRIDWEKVILDPDVISLIKKVYSRMKERFDSNENYTKDFLTKKIMASKSYREGVHRNFDDKELKFLVKSMFRDL